MRNEAQAVAEAIRFLKKRLPGSVVLKHSDIRTAGIPDFSVSYKRKVTWVEAKHFKKGNFSDVKKAFSGVQLATMVLLESQVPAYYLVSYGDEGGFLLPPCRARKFLKEPDGNGSLPYLLSVSSFESDFDATLEALAVRMEP